MNIRFESWEENLLKDLKNPDYAKLFILAAIEAGEDLQFILSKIVKAYGIKKFSKMVDIAEPNLVRALRANHNPTVTTIEKLLKPFGLRIAAAPIKKEEKKKKKFKKAA